MAELKKNFKSGVAGAPDVAAAPYAADAQKKKPDDSAELNLLFSKWHAIVDQVGRADPLSRRYFLDTAPLRVDSQHLVVGFDPEFKADEQRFSDDRVKLALARAVDRFIGRMLSISFEPLQPDDRRALPADHQVTPEKGAVEKPADGMAKWYANPVVKTVVEAFNGEISDVRE